VRDFGAQGNGVDDDWKAIQSAVSSASLANKDAIARCGEKCNATSTMGAIVYFPPGYVLFQFNTDLRTDQL
jgi:polygalacturonase